MRSRTACSSTSRTPWALADAKTFARAHGSAAIPSRALGRALHFAHAGWAFVDISAESNPSPDENYYLLYDHPYSFESDSWLERAASRPIRPVCIMNAGYSSGWCEHSFGLPLVAVEILCRAKGDAACSFIMAPPERIEGHIAHYAEHHPELAARIVNYKIPGFFSEAHRPAAPAHQPRARTTRTTTRSRAVDHQRAART